MKSLVVLLSLLLGQFAFATPDCSNAREKARIDRIAQDLSSSLVGMYGIENLRVRDCDVNWAAKVLKRKVTTVVRTPECGIHLTFSSEPERRKFAGVVIREGGQLRSESGETVRVCGTVAQ
jgi:hypothetical protein